MGSLFAWRSGAPPSNQWRIAAGIARPSARDANSVGRWRQGSRGPVLSAPKPKGKPLDRLSRFVVQHPTLASSGVQQKGLGESLRLRRRRRDHLITADLRLLAMRAS